jgi:oxygen-independent coproporphyrinogen-3 oxidase
VTGRPGAYVHIPYCAHRCTYCSFVAVTGRETEKQYFDAVVREVRARAGEVEGPFDTVYLGGGTPSYVEPSNLARVLTALGETFGVAAGAEVTAESNPDDLDDRRLSALGELGVTRLSIGIQSLSDGELEPLERRHDASGALEALRRAVAHGLRVSADLMIGIPGQSRESLRHSLETVLAAGVGHVSVYLLEIEKAPRLVAMKAASPGLFAGDEEAVARWELVDDLCTAEGLTRYETSNWAKEGEESRHNLKYWRREPVVALGVSAASFDGTTRRTNSGSIPAYLQAVGQAGTAFASKETLPADAALRERVLLGLRMTSGVSESAYAEAVATLPASDRAHLDDAFTAGLLTREGGSVRLTRSGVLLSNEVFLALL